MEKKKQLNNTGDILPKEYVGDVIDIKEDNDEFTKHIRESMLNRAMPILDMNKEQHIAYPIYHNHNNPSLKARLGFTSDVILDVSKSGLNLLAYIIDRNDLDENYNITLDKVSIITYFAEKLKPGYASTTNVNRGIKNLIDLDILEHKVADIYTLNEDYVCKLK